MYTTLFVTSLGNTVCEKADVVYALEWLGLQLRDIIWRHYGYAPNCIRLRIRHAYISS